MKGFRLLLSVLALWFTASPDGFALEVKEMRWGFDGRAVPGRFNLLSIRVAEPGPAPFEGELRLFETRGLDQTVGAPYVQPLYLTPGTERWVQFVPFVNSEFEMRLRWGDREKERVPVPAPKFGAPATVLLIDPASPFAADARLKAFPEDLFPTSVALTDGLDQVALDHVPRWDAPRREAFLDWLRRGGIVHLLRGPSGHPIWEGDLAVLNTVATRERVGAGTVVKHDVTRGEFSEGFSKDAGYAVREIVNEQTTGPILYHFDQMLLRSLASLTKPKVAWWLLYLLTIAYLVVIGPVHYRWSRKIDYRVAIAGFLGTVAVFALAFIIAGRRGSGERQAAHSISVAQALGGNRWDVRRWTNAFATSGDYYRLSYAAPGNYFSATSDTEAVNGRILSGRDGYFDVDIPLYSSRPFLHRAAMNGPGSEVQVVEWKSNRIELQLAADFPEEKADAWARHGGRFFPLTVAKQQLTWSQTSSEPPQEEPAFFAQDHMQRFQVYEWSAEKFEAKDAVRPLIANFLGDVKGLQHPWTPRPTKSDHLQLFILAKVPDRFAMRGKGFSKENGWVLFVMDVIRPSAAVNRSGEKSPAGDPLEKP
jgi:hypothetical protein